MRRAAVAALVGGFILLIAGGAVATSTSLKTYWGRGKEAVLPSPTASEPDIGSLSCPSVGNCTAVGGYYDGAGRHQGLVLDETAGKWRRGVRVRLPANHGAKYPDGDLLAVSCASAGNCSAVGTYGDKAQNYRVLLLTETDGTWGRSVEASFPANAAKAAYQLPWDEGDVSCASAGNCTVVGVYDDKTGHEVPVVFTETDGVWATGVELLLPGNADTEGPMALQSVSCPSVGNCVAVGEYSNDDPDAYDTALVLEETAGSWARGIEAPLPANSDPVGLYGSVLRSVSCTSVGNCSAVGNYTTAAGTRGLLLTETAGSWAQGVEATGAPDIDSVSCSSAGNCSAVGAEYGGALWLFTETAGSWSAGVKGALPSNASWTDPDLSRDSITCSSPGNCTAAGAYHSRSRTSGSHAARPVLFTETAGVWAQGAAIALPANATFPQEESRLVVACPKAEHCSAVGTYESGGAGEGLLVNGPSLMTLAEVPSVVGKTLAKAKRSIRSHGFSVGKVRRVRYQFVKRGHVISQRPSPGEAVKPGTKVNVTVSRG